MIRLRTFHVALLLAITAATACSPDDGPTGVAEAFYTEMAAGDIEAAKMLSTPDTAKMLAYLASMHGAEMFEVIAKGGASGELIEGDNALVSFVEGGGYATVPLVKMDGEWKVDFATMVKAHMKQREPVQLRL